LFVIHREKLVTTSKFKKSLVLMFLAISKLSKQSKIREIAGVANMTCLGMHR